MKEVKSVKVDNWGVFFLQKLQNFFNKTDYCDLTLQFNDNSQLKVHRLVLSACTDYFNVLEQTCEVIDDILIMPAGLQADVIVPIVNFMYTGTLEFEIEMYGRLLKTARDMNMTVLLKLLEAHKRTVDSSRPQQVRRPPKSFPVRRPPAVTQIRVERPYPPHTSQVNNSHDTPRAIPVSAHQLRTLQIKHVAPSTSYYTPTATSEPASLVARYAHNKTPMKGPSRFECNDETTLPPDSFEQFDSISYESKPLITANQVCKEEIEDYDNLIPAHDTSSTFEQLRKGYTGNKRPSSSVSSFESPPEKKPNIQDVKEYAEQQRMRKQITAEYDDDNEYDDVLDDEFHNDDDDEDYVPPSHLQKSAKKLTPSSAPKHDKDPKATIVVKDTVGSNVNHAKIISEVLKKYPHLVKNNKNIKLKIMAKSSTSPNQTQSIIIKQEPDSSPAPNTQLQYVQRSIQKGQSVKSLTPKLASPSLLKPVPTQISTAVASATTIRLQGKPIQQQQPPPRQMKQQQVVQNIPPTSRSTIVTQKVPITTNPAPRRIDSKTMHALIAQGANNTTGPWLCLRCGVNGRPISIPSYRGFRRHLINTHQEKVDPRLCEHCGWRSANDKELHHHNRVQHDVEPPAVYVFPSCTYCPSILLDKAGLELHLKEDHPDRVIYRQQCMYCDEVFKEEEELYNHMNTHHKSQAQKDGLIDYTDDEDTPYYTDDQTTDKGIKILSNITISPHAAIKANVNKLGAQELSSVASGIAASLGLIDSSDSQDEIQFLEQTSFINTTATTTASSAQEPKFVNADGQIMELTKEQRDEIISQLGSQPEGGVVMVLNDSFPAGAIGEGGDDEVKLEAEDENLLTEYGSGDEKHAEGKEKSTESNDKMEWQSDKQSSEGRKDTKQAEEEDEEEADATAEKEEDETLKDDESLKIHDESIEEVHENEQPSKKQPVDKASKENEKEKLEKAKEKLKLLAGDWSDDDDDEEAENENATDEGNSKENVELSRKTSKPVEDDDDRIVGDNVDSEVLFETTTGNKDDDKLNESIESETVETEKPATVEGTEDDANAADVRKIEDLDTPKKEQDEEAATEVVEEEEPMKDDEAKVVGKKETNETDKDETNVEDKDTKSTTKSDQKDEHDADKDEKKSDKKAITASKTEKNTDKKASGKETTKATKGNNGGKKNDDGGERIRTLISEWGDDDDEEEDL